ncbi:hypothetical protein [Adlercreutzia sp. ZJ304]|uniref:hypothetical protein n=1 Tax=Adlercreutzia sp. ZJ304 TaxID=2709791 RepID=UPI0013E9EC42|nr:hypothetical protein [Adlercreutzia sp. ZJ304]
MNNNHHRYESIKKLLDTLPSKGYEFIRFIEDCFWELTEKSTGKQIIMRIRSHDDGSCADIIP